MLEAQVRNKKMSVEEFIRGVKEKRKKEREDPRDVLNKKINDYINSQGYISTVKNVLKEFYDEIDKVLSWIRDNIGTGGDSEWYDDWKDELGDQVEKHNQKFPKEVAKAKKDIADKDKLYDNLSAKLNKLGEKSVNFKNGVETFERMILGHIYREIKQKFDYPSDASDYMDKNYPNISSILSKVNAAFENGLTSDNSLILRAFGYGLYALNERATTKPQKELISQLAKLAGK